MATREALSDSPCGVRMALSTCGSLSSGRPPTSRAQSEARHHRVARPRADSLAWEVAVLLGRYGYKGGSERFPLWCAHGTIHMRVTVLWTAPGEQGSVGGSSPPPATLEACGGDCGLPRGEPTETNSTSGVAGKEGPHRRSSCPTSSNSPSESWSVCTGGDGPRGSAPTKCSSTSPKGEG